MELVTGLAGMTNAPAAEGRKMKISLKIKLILSYLMISLILVITLLFFARHTVNREFENYVRENQEKTGKDIAGQVDLIFRNDAGLREYELYRRIGEYAIEKGLVLRIEDHNGNQIWCMDCEAPERCGMMLAGMEDNMNRIHHGFAGQYEETYYPVEQDGRLLGNIVLGYYGPFYYDNLDIEFLTMLNRIFTAAGAGALVVSVMLGLYMAGRISNPIKQVIRQTGEIGKGNYGSLIEGNSGTLETEQLIGSVNALAVTLEKQKELRKRLAQDYAHEFRTPLASLQSNLEAMIDGIWEPTRERLLSLDEELQRLSRMLGQLNDLVEVEDNLTLIKSRFRLTELIRPVLINFESDIHNKRLQVELAGEDFEISADKDKIGQVVVNLLSNAIKYSKADGRIIISLAQAENGYSICVRDDGIGIPAADLPYVFEHLYRADQSRASVSGGSGIGLAVVKAIVEAHGGVVTVESEEGKGTAFTLNFPG